jgi:hypothetical protein
VKPTHLLTVCVDSGSSFGAFPTLNDKSPSSSGWNDDSAELLPMSDSRIDRPPQTKALWSHEGALPSLAKLTKESHGLKRTVRAYYSMFTNESTFTWP